MQIRLVLGLPRALDRAALAALFKASPGFSLLAAESRLNDVVSSCRKHLPDAVVLDAVYPLEVAARTVKLLLNSGAVRAVAFLDDSFALARALIALEIPGCCYCTRSAEIQDLHLAITRVVAAKDHDPKTKTRLDCASDHIGIQSLFAHDLHGILALSKREREVMVHLASGRTVDQTAELLGLAPSTVDNHKTRILKKLKVHRTIDVVRIAYSAGLVECNDAQRSPRLACSQ